MQIPELLARLASLFPHQFQSQEAVNAWAPIYRRALREGPDLGEALEDCLAQWTRRDAPRPGDIARFMPARDCKTSTGWSEGAQVAHAYKHVQARAGHILADTVAAGRFERCERCSPDFPDCRCPAWHCAWDNAFALEQQLFQVDHGVRRDVTAPNQLTEKQIQGILTARSAPVLGDVRGFEPLGPAHVPAPEGIFPPASRRQESVEPGGGGLEGGPEDAPPASSEADYGALISDDQFWEDFGIEKGGP